MCKTKPNIFPTTSLSKHLHQPNIPNMHLTQALYAHWFAGPTKHENLQYPGSFKVEAAPIQGDSLTMFWNHQHTPTCGCHCPLLKVHTCSHSALETLWRNKKKDPARTESPKISNVFTNTSDLDAIKYVQAKKSSNLIGSTQKLIVFSTNKPFTASVRIWSSPSATFDKPSLVQRSRGIPLKRALNLEHTKVSWEQTYYSFPAFLWFPLWSCSVVPLRIWSCGMLCYLGSTLAYLTSPPCSTKPPGTQNSKRRINIT